MSIEKAVKPVQESEDHLAEPEVDCTTGLHTEKPVKLTLAGHVIFTIRILAGFGMLGVALWAVEFWTSVR